MNFFGKKLSLDKKCNDSPCLYLDPNWQLEDALVEESEHYFEQGLESLPQTAEIASGVSESLQQEPSKQTIEPENLSIASHLGDDEWQRHLKGLIGEDLFLGLNNLASLAANASESYSLAIFVCKNENSVLYPAGVHTLSREFIRDVEIPIGSGLVGWVAQSRERLQLSPFERDASSLQYYSLDQNLKSFLALPILSKNEEILGVLVCDNKKSYGYNKISQNVLHECAAQAAFLIEACKELRKPRGNEVLEKKSVSALDTLLETLRSKKHEQALLQAACDISEEIISRDAFAIVSVPDGGIGEGSLYTLDKVSHVQHRLFDLVQKHKKVICRDRSVHVLPSNELADRSFLSVPFCILDEEAGSFNFLARSGQAFNAKEISAIEAVASVVGERLEHIRLREQTNAEQSFSRALSSRMFLTRARTLIGNKGTNSTALSVVRIFVEDVYELEKHFGFQQVCSAMDRLSRLIEQSIGREAICCRSYDCSYVILLPKQSVNRVLVRIKNLCKKTFSEIDTEKTSYSEADFGQMLADKLRFSSVGQAENADDVEDLLQHSLHSFLEENREINNYKSAANV